MNAAVRAVVRTAIHRGAEVFAIFEGYQGMIDGGDGIRQFGWDDVGNVLHRGGTVIGTFRSKQFRERDGRRLAARNLLAAGIDRLVVIGGDGSMAIAHGLSQRGLPIVGVPKTIDNDIPGCERSFGFDTAVSTVTEAIYRL